LALDVHLQPDSDLVDAGIDPSPMEAEDGSRLANLMGYLSDMLEGTPIHPSQPRVSRATHGAMATADIGADEWTS
jgi:hypothetical protein